MSNRIFISYSSKDIQIAEKLHEKLTGLGYLCWLGEYEIHGGDNWLAKIHRALRSVGEDGYFVVLLSKHSITSGWVRTEIGIATKLNIHKIPVNLDGTVLPDDISCPLWMEAVEMYKMDEEQFLRKLCELMPSSEILPFSDETPERRYKMQLPATMTDAMQKATDPIFDGLADLGGYSWGQNKSIIQNIDGGWFPCQVIFEETDDTLFAFKDPELHQNYLAFCASEEFQKEIFRGQNRTRWMLREFSTYGDRLFLSIKKTEWSQTQFIWHKLFQNPATRKEAVQNFFQTETIIYPNSLCLHLVLIDSENKVIATQIQRRKKNDYPTSIAVTLGEQLSSVDFRGFHQNEIFSYWIKRAIFEELHLNETNYQTYINEPSARILSLTMEGDIYNFALVCCLKLRCTVEQLQQYYRLHRSAGDEFDLIYGIPPEEIDSILQNSITLREQYHPSSFLRLLYAKQYLLTYH